LLSEEENTAELVGPATEAEMETAITGNVANLLTVVCSDFALNSAAALIEQLADESGQQVQKACGAKASTNNVIDSRCRRLFSIFSTTPCTTKGLPDASLASEIP
jgi:hypothetical protein